MEKNKEIFFLIRGKVFPERILLCKGRILSYKPYLDTTHYRIRIQEFKNISLRQLKDYFIGDRFLTVGNEKKLRKIIRNSSTIEDVNTLLSDILVTVYVDQIYIFKSYFELHKSFKILMEYYLRHHIKMISNILSNPNYNGTLNMTKEEFSIRFRASFIDKYTKSFEDNTIDDFLKNL